MLGSNEDKEKENIERTEYADVSLFDELDMIIYIIDRKTDELLFVNRAGRESFGITEADYAGKKCYEVLQKRDKPCERCAQRMTEHGEWKGEGYNEYLKRVFQAFDSPIRYKGHDARIEVVVDVTDSVRQRENLQKTLQAEAVLNETVQILYSETDLNMAFDKMLEHIGLYFRAGHCCITDVKDDTLTMTHEWVPAGVTRLMDMAESVPKSKFIRWFDIFEHYNNVKIRDVNLLKEIHRDEYDSMTAQGSKNCVVAPIQVGGKIVALLSDINIKPDDFDSASMMMLTLSYFISASIVADTNRRLLEKASYFDEMTGVANRNAFIRDIERYQKIIDKGTKPVGVIYFDLNGLKRVNDSEGHRAGDRLIIDMADTIALFYRKPEIYRTGGDEFVVICFDMPKTQFTARLAKAMSYIDSLPGLSVSVGYAWSDGAKQTVQQTVALADARMYTDKQLYYEEEGRRR